MCLIILLLDCGMGVTTKQAINTCNCSDTQYCNGEYIDYLICPKVSSRDILRQCHPCPPGAYCGYRRREPQNCSDHGLACPDGGSFCKNGLIPSPTGEWQCDPCPIGRYCNQTSLHAMPCPPGYAAPLAGQATCTRCPAGNMCPDAMV